MRVSYTSASHCCVALVTKSQLIGFLPEHFVDDENEVDHDRHEEVERSLVRGYIHAFHEPTFKADERGCLLAPRYLLG